MSRTGIEVKPIWKLVPPTVRQQVDVALEAPVVRATRIWGGYAPTPTYRLVLADGRRAFFKGSYRDSNEYMKYALVHEERVYRDLAQTLGQWMPQLYATFQQDDWHVLLLEDLGPQSVPPWSRGRARAITHALAQFHQSSLGSQAPTWLSRPDMYLPLENWMQTTRMSLEFQRLAALVGEDAPEALTWFRMISPRMEDLLARPVLSKGPYAILHGDLRSDNLRFTRERLSLFDWPAITVGRPEWDMVAFAQSVTVEDGPLPEQIMAWYGEQFPLDNSAVEYALAWWLTFFARRAWQPEVPDLPRLRRFQRQQLGVLISWTARHWSLPQPAWTARLMV